MFLRIGGFITLELPLLEPAENEFFITAYFVGSEIFLALNLLSFFCIGVIDFIITALAVEFMLLVLFDEILCFPREPA